MMLDALASRLALDRLRKACPSAARAPSAVAVRDDHRGRLHRVARRVIRAIRRRRSGAGRVPPGAFELEAAHELTTAQLWGVWTVADLESGLALRAWRLAAPRASGGRASRLPGGARA
jgi:hypothetical protein